MVLPVATSYSDNMSLPSPDAIMNSDEFDGVTIAGVNIVLYVFVLAE